MIIWTDPAVQAAAIQTIGTIFATVVAAIFAAMIGKKISDRDKLQEKLDAAIGDIGFLLLVEEQHCEMHKLTKNRSCKLTVRQSATDQGAVWSGRFTPGRAKAMSQKD